MGKKNKRGSNPFAAKKRLKKQEVGEVYAHRLTNNPSVFQANKDEGQRLGPYPDIKRENSSFEKYYHAQNICPESEWSSFLSTIRADLPTTFRITGTRSGATVLLKIIKKAFSEEYVRGVSELRDINEIEIEMPICLPWYPKELAWQLQLTRKDIRRSQPLFKLHNFLISETNAGSISRQEAVSMIPPLVLDVKSSDKVLDMCAAPGSKTAQLIEALHSGNTSEIPSGFVLANDVDNNRCYMLVHQAKRLNSPCLVVTNHDSAFFPNLVYTESNKSCSVLKFDKILCDVPCSGDGTLRKNPDIWQKWNTMQGNNLHGVQYRILRRGAELLSVGGRLVYSTCSINPVENEAVIQRIIKESEGALEVTDVSKLIPGLKYVPGLTSWKVANKDVDLFSSFLDVPEKFHTVIRPSMFPLACEEIKSIGLEKCIRILPHYQNTGAFFVAVLEKKKLLPWETNTAEKEVNKTTSTGENLTVFEPQRKTRGNQGYKEDPFVFFGDDKEIWESIKSFYELNETFNMNCLLTRCRVGKKKNIYFCTEPVRDLITNNEHMLKIINTGVKTFVRCDNRFMKCSFRLAQEGLETIHALIGKARRIQLNKEDLIKLLTCTDPTKPPTVKELHEETQAQLSNLELGSCILEFKEPDLDIVVAGWRGITSLRAYTDTSETVHLLRLLGSDVSMFEQNKFMKSELTS